MGFWSKLMGVGKAQEEDSSSDVDLVKSLDVVVKKDGLNPGNIRLNVPVSGQNMDRRSVYISDGKKDTCWQIDSLASLFRGSRVPPPESEMAYYPEDYVVFFHGIESVALTFCIGNDRNPTDSQFLEVYTQMRRRPDGKSLGDLHDVVWQSAALALGLRPWSEAEYTAVFGQLGRSTRHFQIGASSRNYIEYIRKTIGGKAALL